MSGKRILRGTIFGVAAVLAATVGESGASGVVRENRHAIHRPAPVPEVDRSARPVFCGTTPTPTATCATTNFNRCHYKEWQRFTESVRALPKDRQLDAVNTFFNKHRYIVDPINWGVADYWETPGQFFDKNGDCEDYAIAKYMTLRDLGWETSAMRVVIVQDMNLKLVHAILAVKTDGKTVILDNQLAVVIEPRRIKHYRPIYAVNEDGWWRFH